jgi:aryl-alcohol dehydrogenase-like predicted oxidoreductase
MEIRVFGRTGMRLSVLGFGCGAVGGLMVRGDPLDQERTIARAISAGVNYFDTAVQYGNGESEKNLGRVLQRLKPANVAVGTKVRLPSADFGGIADAVAKSLEGSLARLDLDRVDIFHLHNAITETGGGEALSVRQVLGEVVPAFERLRQQGKTRFLGLTAIGDTAALHQVIDGASSTALRWSTTCSIRPQPPGCRRIIQHRITDGCLIIPGRPVSALSASACSPAARCPARPSVIRLRARRPSRSARL